MCHIPKVSLLPISRGSKGDLGESSEDDDDDDEKDSKNASNENSVREAINPRLKTKTEKENKKRLKKAK